MHWARDRVLRVIISMLGPVNILSFRLLNSPLVNLRSVAHTVDGSEIRLTSMVDIPLFTGFYISQGG